MADVLHAQQGDTLDLLLHRDRGLGPAALDAALAANPGLAGLGPVLPVGTPVTVPAAAVVAPTMRPLRQLWD